MGTPMTPDRKYREVRTKPISFDLQKHAAEAIVENIYTHTLGLAGYPPVFLGSAVVIRWNGRAFVTADHVIKAVDDSQLLFAPRPPVPLKFANLLELESVGSPRAACANSEIPIEASVYYKLIPINGDLRNLHARFHVDGENARLVFPLVVRQRFRVRLERHPQYLGRAERNFICCCR
jgi:hypothetical protein